MKEVHVVDGSAHCQFEVGLVHTRTRLLYIKGQALLLSLYVTSHPGQLIFLSSEG